jgi:transposase
MSRIPESILKHRQPGTEIKKVGDKYYMQRITCKWIPETRQRKKVVLEYLGQVTEEGLVPKRHRLAAIGAVYSKEFGATWLLRLLSKDVHDLLRKHFADDGDWIYACAMLRCIRTCAMSYIEHSYSVSYLSEAIPGLHLSSQNISNLMVNLGCRRKAMVAFMKEFIPSDDWYAIFDGTSIVCNSQRIHDAQRGYNSHGCHDPQLNLMYAIALQDNRLCPVFYKQYPGSVRDVSAFMNMLKEMGLKGALVMADKGFVMLSHLDELEALGLEYVMPLKRTSTEYSRAPLDRPGYSGFTSRFEYNGRVIWYYEQPVEAGDTHRYFLYVDETLRHLEDTAHLPKRMGRETPEEIRKAATAQMMHGTIVLKTNKMDFNGQDAYRSFKAREDVEQLFDMYKVEEDFGTTAMHSGTTLEACLFLNHISILMAYRVYARLRDNDALSKYAVVKTLQNLLWDIRATNAGGKWELEPVPKAARLAIESMGLEIPTTAE